MKNPNPLPFTLFTILLFTILIAAILLLEGCSSQGPAESDKTPKPEVIKIGATLPLSGDVAMLGESARNAMQLALGELKNTKYTYELIFEDDKIDPKTASTTATKLITVDNVDAILSFSSGIGNVVNPLAEQNKVIHFGVASDPNVAKGTYNFIHWTPPDEEAKVWVEEIVRRGYKRVALLVVQQQGELAIVESIHKYLAGTGVEVVNEQTFGFGEKDFRTMLIKSQEARPDIYIILAFSPEIDLLYKQFQEVGYKQPVTTIEAFELSNNPAQFEGLWYVNGADPSNTFIEAYKSAYGKDVQLGGGNAYDILKLMVEGFERAGLDPAVKPSAKEVAQTLMKLKGFQGALGTLNMGEEGIVWSGAVIRNIQGGKPVTIGPYQGHRSQGKEVVVE